MKKDTSTLKFLAAPLCVVVIAVACIAPREKGFVSGEFKVPQSPPEADYVIEAEISVDGESVSVEGHGSMTLRNTSTLPLSVLALEWTASDARRLEVHSGGKPLRILNEERNLPLTTPLFIELEEPLYSGGRCRLDVHFTFPAGINNGQISLQTWYPRLWWEGIPVRNTFKVKLQPPPGYVMATSGRLDPSSGYYENDNVTSRFGIFLSNTMQAETRESEGVLITTLFPEKGRDGALFCLEEAMDIIRFYKGRLGIYPHRALCIIPGGARPMGGYPFSSGIVVIHGLETFDPAKTAAEQVWWTWITAHEIGHEYWGEYVMSDDVRGQYTSSWLMIGMGIWADKEYMRHRGLGWERHKGFLDRYLRGFRAGNDTTMDATSSLRRIQNFDVNNVIIHGKGFAVVSALETLLGDDVFDRIYLQCVRSHGGSRLGWRDLRRICEDVTGEDLGWFFEAWVRSNKALNCVITSEESRPEGGGFVSEIRIEYAIDSLRMPVPVEAVFEDGTRQVKWTDRFARENILRFESASPLIEGHLDPGKRLAVINESLPRTTGELVGFIEELDWTGSGDIALQIFERSETADIAAPHAWLKMGLLLYDGEHYPQAFEAFGRLAKLETSDLNRFTALVWLGHLKDLSGDRDSAIAYYRQALERDTGRTMQHSQYGMHINRAWVKERLETPFKRK